jgi:hypothetical protein
MDAGLAIYKTCSTFFLGVFLKVRKLFRIRRFEDLAVNLSANLWFRSNYCDFGADLLFNGTNLYNARRSRIPQYFWRNIAFGGVP